jgi:hypothetical protein
MTCSVPGTSTILPPCHIDADRLERGQLAALADEFLGRDRELALAAFLVLDEVRS